MKHRILFFLVPSTILIGLGFYGIGNNIINYFHGVEEINNTKSVCNGIPCVCSNAMCFTKDDLTKSLPSDFGWSIGFVSLGSIILVFSRRWWK